MTTTTSIATKLSRNPLGLIALFVVLVEVIAGVAATSQILSPFQRDVLVWFIVIFPMIVLICFVHLVIFHAGKLYAPSDFDDQSDFIRVLGHKVEAKVEEITYDAISEMVQLDMELIPLREAEAVRRAGDAMKRMELYATWINHLEVGAKESKGASKLSYVSALRQIYPEYLHHAARYYGSSTREYAVLRKKVMAGLERIASHEI